MKKAVFWPALAVLIFSFIMPVSSQNYIEGSFEILDNGFVSADIETNTDLEIEGLKFENNKITGTTSALTSKQGDIWKFSFESEKDYSIILIKIYFHKNTESIKNINSNLRRSMKFDSKILIEAVGSNSEIVFSADYTLKKSASYSFILIFSLIIVILALLFFLARKIKNKQKRIDILKEILNENEEKIVNLLMKKPMRQKHLRQALNIPKASFSRYMYNLEKKKIIIREGEGKNKLVRLK